MRHFILALALAVLLSLAGCGGEPENNAVPSSKPAGSGPGTMESGSTAPPSTTGDAAKPAEPSAPGGPTKVDQSKLKSTSSGLKYAILKEGKGAEAKAGQPVEVHYTGWLQSDGTKFDSSVDRGEPFGFNLGAGMVIPGWDEGVQGMKEGEKRQLIVPAKLGYGDAAAPGGKIPPNSTLIFEVELLKANAG